MTDVTVLILVYNDPAFVERAIQSVLNQSYSELSVVILDNGSTDQTPSVLRKFSHDPRVSITTNPVNQRSEFGAREAMKVQTKYLSFLFSDDSFEANRVEIMRRVLEESADVDAVFANNTFQNEHGESLARAPHSSFDGDIATISVPEHLGRFLRDGNTLHPCAMMIRSDVYQKLGGFKPYLHRIGDMTFFARLLGQGRVRFLSQKLQRVTLFASGRNESAKNLTSPLAVANERTAFLEEYRSPKILAQLEQILPDLRPRLGPNTSLPEREFFLGSSLHQIPTVDHQLFGIRAMMAAFDKAPAEIDAICVREFGTSFSQYMFTLQQDRMTNPALRTLTNYQLRRFVLRLPGGAALWNFAKWLAGRLRR